LMSRFTKIKNFGSSASVLSYAHFQAFKFPDSMEVHFQCTIQICRYQCPEQCTQSQGPLEPNPIHGETTFTGSVGNFHNVGKPREERDVSRHMEEVSKTVYKIDSTEVGLNRIIQVVSTGDLAFTLQANESVPVLSEEKLGGDIICMSALGFAASLVILIAILVVSCLISVFLCLRQRPSDFKTASLPTSLQTLPYDMRTFPRKPHGSISKR